MCEIKSTCTCRSGHLYYKTSPHSRFLLYVNGVRSKDVVLQHSSNTYTDLGQRLDVDRYPQP